jgi:hypothetical protein
MIKKPPEHGGFFIGVRGIIRGTDTFLEEDGKGGSAGLVFVSLSAKRRTRKGNVMNSNIGGTALPSLPVCFIL